MTPDQAKKALPTLKTGAAGVDRPTTFKQWQVLLYEIKTLYLKGQWKQCAARCSRLIAEPTITPHPAHAAFLHFYYALSNEMIARSLNNLSIAKLPLLQTAKESYTKALASLKKPTACQLFKSSRAVEPSKRFPIRVDDSSPPVTPTPNPQEISNHLFSPYSPDGSPVHVPSPLRIHKKVNTGARLTTPVFGPTPASGPTLVGTNLVRTSASALKLPSVTFSASKSTWLRSCAEERYFAHRIDFIEMLENHTQVMDNVIHATEEAQANRCIGNRLATHGTDDVAKAADVQNRIKKLKAQGWTGERFRPGKYEELCARALAEL